MTGARWWWAAAAAEQEPERRPAVELTPAERDYFRSFAGEPVTSPADERAADEAWAASGIGQDFDRLGR